MRLLYTGASNYLGVQTNPLKSLGGLISSSPLPNGTLDEILGSISEKQMFEGGKEIKGFALINDTGNTVVAPKLFYANESNDPITNIRMSIVAVGEDTACGTFFMETIANGQQSPLSASFKDNRGEVNAIVMPDMPNNTFIGMWIERSINVNKSGGGVNGLMSCDNMYAKHITVPVNQKQTITTVADVAGNLGGKYFELTSPNGKFYVWYNTGTDNDPNVSGREGIEIGINANDTAATVANNTQLQLHAILNSRGEINASVVGNVITIENISSGKYPSIEVSTSGFATTVTVVGASKDVEKEESINLFIKY